MIHVPIDTELALKYFKANDPIMYQLVQQALTAPRPLILPTPKPVEAYFADVVSAIIGQQISTKAAVTVRTRFIETVGVITPETVKSMPFDTLKACGLSARKTEYIKYNADIWHEIPFGNFVHLDNETIITTLTTLHGIGRWTAEMFLIFSLARPDVFSRGDFGLMKSLYQTYHYRPHHTRKITRTIDRWSPHRTLAALALWHALDNDPAIL